MLTGRGYARICFALSRGVKCRLNADKAGSPNAGEDEQYASLFEVGLSSGRPLPANR